MAENPFHSLVRILGGVVLMQGKLGHQVLGQLLIADSREVTIAGASLVIAATSREKNAVGQAVIRTLAPAIAIHALTLREEERLKAARDDFARRVREFEKSQARIEVQRSEVTSLHAKVKKHRSDVDAQEGRVTNEELSLQARAAVLDTHEESKRAHEERVTTLEQKAANVDDIERKNRQLAKKLKELSTRLRQHNAKRSAKAAAKRPRPRKKKS